MDPSQTTSEWWKNLNNEPVASTSSRHSHTAAIIKANILQTSTSESEKEIDLKKRKVHLKALNNRKRGNNTSNVKSVMPESSNANEIVQSSDESDNAFNKRLKFKSRFMQRARISIERNAFADALADKSSANLPTSNLNKENDIHESLIPSRSSLSPSKRYASKSKAKIDITHESSPIRKSLRASLNADEIVQSSDENDNALNKRLKLKSRFMHRARVNKEGNAFADALADNSGANLPTSDVNKQNDIHESLVPSRSSLSPSKRYVSRSKAKIDVTPESSPIRKSLRASLNADEIVQSSDESDNALNKRLKFKSRFTQRARIRIERNAFADALADKSSANLPTSDLNEENDIHESLIPSRSSLSPSKRYVSKSKAKIDITHESSPIRKSLRASLNADENVQSSDENDNALNKRLKLKSRFMQRARVNKEGNAFADALADNSGANLPTSDVNRENDIHESLVPSRSSLSPSKRYVSRSKAKIDVTHESSPIRKSLRASLNADEIVQSSDENDNALNKRLKLKSRFMQRARINTEGNAFAGALADNSGANLSTSDLNRENVTHESLVPSRSSLSPSERSINRSKAKTPKKIDDFFKVKRTSTTTKQLSVHAQKSQDFSSEKMEKIKTELEKIKNREMAAMKIVRIDKEESELKIKNVKFVMSKQDTKKKPLTANTKVVDKAFLVNGKVYKAPRLPRPKYWVTNRLYKFLWDRLEPNYKLATRLKSEKFVQELAKIVALIERRKNYENYKAELRALMREMARLKIINTRMDFYHFCQDFLPYEFRVKVVPMLMPGNKSNIPYDPEKLHTPLL